MGKRTRGLASQARVTRLQVGRNCARLDVPWARCRVARGIREFLLNGLLGPAIDFYTRRRVLGREHFDGLDAPVVLVANHSSHMDTPTILRSLPRKWRQRTAVAAAADYFYRKRLVAHAVSLLLNTVPMQRRGGGLDPTSTSHVDRLMEQRWNLLIFPEGTRSRDGRVGRLRSGAAVLAANHDLAIVPVHVTGTHSAMPPGRRWPRRRAGHPLRCRHPIEVRFGAPIRPREGEHRSDVMERVRLFFAESGAETTPDPRVLARGERFGDRAAAPVS